MPANGARLSRRLPALDADALVSHAARHGVSAMVADFLAASNLSLPEAAHRRLQGDARDLIARGLRMRRLTLKVLDALAARGITPVLLKGSGLAERLYPEQPLARPATDVDVWVTPEELDQAGRALAALNFAEQHDAGLADVAHEHHHVSWAGHEGLVELHFRLFSGFGGRVFDDASLRSRLVTGTFHGREVRWLHHDDEFVYLATHAANHAFLRASWLVDLQRALASRSDFDWARMATMCRAAGFHAAVSAALWVLREPLQTVLPHDARHHFGSGLTRRLANARVFSPRQLEAATLAAGRWSGFAMRLWLVDSPRDGLRHAVDGGRRWLRRLRSTP